MVFTQERYPARACRQEDFGTSEKAKELFESWNGFILACPDLKEGENLYFQGDPAAMYSKSLGV